MATFLHKLVLASAMATSVISPAAAQTLFALKFPLEMPFWTSPPAVYDNAPSGYIRSGMRLCAISGVVTAHNLKFRQLIIANGQTIYIDTSEGYPGGARDPANDRKCQVNAALYAKQSNPQYAQPFGSALNDASRYQGTPARPNVGAAVTAASSPPSAAPLASKNESVQTVEERDRTVSLELKDGGALTITANTDTSITGIIVNRGRCITYGNDYDKGLTYPAESVLPIRLRIGETWNIIITSPTSHLGRFGTGVITPCELSVREVIVATDSGPPEKFTFR